eukprot:CAMPEP_0176077224 /NCGR_PEP_ID=MMETSP0120_2-20121206/38611_1 /TAXON_ID=160619 /ORGANISM="Kryptoperidinium foliaceum, Strain CCMP 1326" /LENGTH=111 /DNA_ID=CAMNT_0017410955 /DNA_START=98 /DNA_END=431 /DNA_ORIENTATION=+
MVLTEQGSPVSPSTPLRLSPHTPVQAAMSAPPPPIPVVGDDRISLVLSPGDNLRLPSLNLNARIAHSPPAFRLEQRRGTVDADDSSLVDHHVHLAMLRYAMIKAIILSRAA